MELARLKIVLDAAKARQDTTTLKLVIEQVGDSADKAGAKATAAFNKTATEASKTTAKTKETSGALKDLGSVGVRTGTLLLGIFSTAAITRFLAESVKVNIEFKRMENVLTGLTGSVGAAKAEIGFLQDVTSQLGLNFRETAQAFVKFASAASTGGLSQRQLRDIFESTSEAARKLGLNTQEQGQVFLAYEQMISKGVVSMEELRRQLGNALPGAFQIAARSMNMSTREFNQFVESGNLLSATFLPRFAQQLNQDVKGAVDNLAISIGNLTNAWDRFKNAIGENLRQSIADPIAGLGAVVSKEATGFDALAAYRRIGGSGSTIDQQIAELRSRFPHATPPSVFQGPGAPSFRYVPQGEGVYARIPVEGARPTQSLDFISEFQRMAAEEPGFARIKQAAFERSMSGQGAGYSFGGGMGLPFTVEQAQGIDPAQLKQIETERNKLLMDRLDGMAKINHQYDEERKRVIALGLDLGHEAELMGLIEDARTKSLEDESTKRAAEDAAELTKNYEAAEKASRKLFLDNLGSETERNIAKINDEFRELVLQYIQLEESGNSGLDYGQIVAARDRALGMVRNRMAFSDTSFGSLTGSLSSAKAQLLTAKDVDEYQNLQARVSDITNEIGRRFKAGTVTMTEAWSFGVQSMIERWGTFKEKVADTAGSIVDQTGQAFGDAFASIITGTKDVATAFNQMTTSILADIARQAAQKYIFQGLIQGIGALGSIGGAASSGSSGIASTDPSTTQAFSGLGGTDHLGGVVLHGGGMVGEDVPVIARRGEVIFTPEQTAALGKAIASNSGGKGRGVTIVNTVDEAAMTEHLIKNQDVVLNIIGRNRKSVRTLLG